MNILITGGAGYIGSHLTHHLMNCNHSVTILDNFNNSLRPTLWGEKVISLDISSPHEMDYGFDVEFDAVIHLAAEKQACSHDIYDNILNTIHVYRYCVSHNIKLMINTSSAAVYGEGVTSIYEESGMVPTSIFHNKIPIDNYGWSKLGAESILNTACDSNNITNVINLRLFNVAGKSVVPSMNKMWQDMGVMSKWRECILNSEDIIVNDPPDDVNPAKTEMIRDYIHVEDVCKAYEKALSYAQLFVTDRGHAVTFNIGSGIPTSMSKLISVYEEVLGLKLDVSLEKCKRKEIIVSCADILHTKNDLKWGSLPDLKNIHQIVESSLI